MKYQKFIVKFLILLFASAYIAAGSAHADSSWSILKYDEYGNPVSVDQGGGEGAASGAPGQGKGAGSGTNPDSKAVEPNEILAVLKTQAELDTLRRLGFKSLELIKMPSLGIQVYRLQIPYGTSLTNAIKSAREALPRAIIDTNDLFDLSASMYDTVGTEGPRDDSRALIGWGQVNAGCGKGLKLGMIDGAVDLSQPALAGQDIIYRSFIKPGEKAAAVDHGTAVAAILVGRPSEERMGGLLPGATLYAAGVFAERDGVQVGDLSAMLKAVDWLISDEVRIINLSVEGAPNAVLTFMINKAAQANIVMIAAAGNKGPDAPPAWPAAHPKVIAVTAIGNDLQLYQYANQGDYIDFSAPGVNMRVETPRGLRDESGTSFAAPFITGIAGVHLLAGFQPDVDKIRESMKRYAKDLGQYGKDKDFGWGLVRLRPKCS